MPENGSPSPVFAFDENRDYFLVTLSVHPKATSGVMTPDVTEPTE